MAYGHTMNENRFNENESNASSVAERQGDAVKPSMKVSGKFYLYIVHCQDNSLYIGSTGLTPPNRVERHNAGIGAKWFLQHGQGTVVYTEEYTTLLEARRREIQIKKWSRIKKEQLILGLKP